MAAVMVLRLRALSCRCSNEIRRRFTIPLNLQYFPECIDYVRLLVLISLNAEVKQQSEFIGRNSRGTIANS
jgi:hypothetical protein